MSIREILPPTSRVDPSLDICFFGSWSGRTPWPWSFNTSQPSWAWRLAGTSRGYRATWPQYGALTLWIQAEVMAIATDLAELVGATLGLNLLFGLPMALAGAVAAVLAFAILRLESHGYRRFELVITGLLFSVAIGFVYEACRVGPSDRLALAALVPHFAGHQSVLLAVAIVGATVMPHAIYLHSDLAKQHRLSRRSPSVGQLIKGQRIDVLVALGGAGLIRVAMLVVAAKHFTTRAYRWTGRCNRLTLALAP